MAEQQPQSIVDRTIDRIHADNQLKEAGFVMSSPHCHPHYEIFYIESGHSSYFVGSGVYELHAGDLLIMPPDVFHFTRYPAACRSAIGCRASKIEARHAVKKPPPRWGRRFCRWSKAGKSYISSGSRPSTG